MKIDGRCHCGQISYEAEVEPSTMLICLPTVKRLPGPHTAPSSNMAALPFEWGRCAFRYSRVWTRIWWSLATASAELSLARPCWIYANRDCAPNFATRYRCSAGWSFNGVRGFRPICSPRLTMIDALPSSDLPSTPVRRNAVPKLEVDWTRRDIAKMALISRSRHSGSALLVPASWG
jgi:hypothetical protein